MTKRRNCICLTNSKKQPSQNESCIKWMCMICDNQSLDHQLFTPNYWRFCTTEESTGDRHCLYVHFYCQHLTGGRVRQYGESQITSWSPPPWTSSWWSPPSWPGDAPLCACGPPLSWNDEPRPDHCGTDREKSVFISRQTVHNNNHHF